MTSWQVCAVMALVACGPNGEGEPGEAGPMGVMGAMGSPGPAGPGALLGEVTGTAQVAVSASTTVPVLIPGLTMTVDVPAGAVLNVHTDGGLQCTGTGTAFSAVDVAIFIDDLESTAARRVIAANTTGVAQMIASWSFSRTFTVATGSHTIEVRALSGDPGSATANVSSAATPQLQGVLTATVFQPAP